MSLDAIEKVTEIEQQMRELRANADAQVQKVKADAERDGQARLVQARAAAAEEGQGADESGRKPRCTKSGGDSAQCRERGRHLAETAEQRLEEAAEFYCRKGCESLRWQL